MLATTQVELELSARDCDLTDIMMFNSRNLGALIVDEDPHVKSWEDGQYNIMNMSIEETHGFGILNEGQAIAVAKNVNQPDVDSPEIQLP